MRKAMQKRYEEWERKHKQPKSSKQEKPSQEKQGFYDNRPHVIPSIAATAMLLGALAQWPYGYYQLLRWAVCGVAIFVAISAYRWQKLWAIWLFGFVAVLFNPLIPVHLSRDVWQPIDVICAILFIFAAVVLREPSKSTHMGNK